MEEYINRLTYIRTHEQDKMIRNKKKTLKQAIIKSYYGADVLNRNTGSCFRALMYPKREGFDEFATEKIVSGFFENKLTVGTVLYWRRTRTNWLIYQQNESEIAYFEGYAKQCKNYSIKTDAGEYETFGSFTMELITDRDLFDEAMVERDVSLLHVYIPDTEENRKVFKSSVRLNIDNTHWRIKTTDWISTSGIICLYCVRDYDGEYKYPTIIVEEKPEEEIYISGGDKIQPFKSARYEMKGLSTMDGRLWAISNNNYVEKTINNDGSLNLLLKDLSSNQNDIIIRYGSYSKVVSVATM